MPVFTFANQAGLDMLETTLVALQDISLEKIFDDNGRKTLCSEFPQIMQQVFISILWSFILTGFVQFRRLTGIFVSGFCVSSRRDMSLKHGETSFIWESSCLESTQWRRECSLYLLCVHQLVLCLRLLCTFVCFFGTNLLPCGCIVKRSMFVVSWCYYTKNSILYENSRNVCFVSHDWCWSFSFLIICAFILSLSWWQSLHSIIYLSGVGFNINKFDCLGPFRMRMRFKPKWFELKALNGYIFLEIVSCVTN